MTKVDPILSQLVLRDDNEVTLHICIYCAISTPPASNQESRSRTVSKSLTSNMSLGPNNPCTSESWFLSDTDEPLRPNIISNPSIFTARYVRIASQLNSFQSS